MINNIKLDSLLNELKQKNTSVDFNKFCDKTWGKSKETFKTCRLLAQTLVEDGYATFTPNSNRYILLTGKGEKFKGYVQTDIDTKTADIQDNELRRLTKENLEFQNESIEHEKSLRDNKSVIDKLTFDNLRLQNKNLRRTILYAIIGFISGLILTNAKDLLIYFHILNP